MIKKLDYTGKHHNDRIIGVFTNQFEMAEKINEIIDAIEFSEKNSVLNDVCDYEEGKTFSDDEYEVIKKCLRYCKHRYYDHDKLTDLTGIHEALSQQDLKIFRQLVREEIM